MAQVGDTLDRYRIESKLDEGGMGVVYKAFDPQLDRLGPLVRQSLTSGEVVPVVDDVASASFVIIDQGVYASGGCPATSGSPTFASRQSPVVASKLGAVGFGLSVEGFR